MESRFRKVKLTQSVVDKAAPEAQRYVLTDTAINGFWLVVEPTGRKSFKLRYRVGGGRGATTREPKIGDAASMRTEKARAIATEWLAEVALGRDPGGARKAYREAPTMAQLFDRYVAEHARVNKKASSAAEDERIIRDYLRPEFGRRKVAEVKRAEVDAFHKRLAEKPYRANRALALLSKAFNLAEVWEMRPDGSNPCRHVRKFAEAKRKRFLSPRETARLGEVLRQALEDGFITLPAREGVRDKPRRAPISPWAVAAIRLMIFTGARKGEILGLRWDWVDMENGRANLPDSKTGERTIILPPPALEVLAALPRSEDNPHVLQGAKPGAHFVNLKDPWIAIREAAGLEDVRPHDLRHSFASVGAAGGASLPMIGALLGHTQAQTTERYAHLADDPLQVAAGKISGEIDALLNGTAAGHGELVRISK